MKLIIHMGAHKTATKSFQRICVENARSLANHGLLFPSYKNWSQHGFIAWRLQQGAYSEVATFFTGIYRQAIDKGADHTLISGEDFENLLIDTRLALDFQSLALTAGYSQIEWVFVKRDPFSYLMSIYAEMGKHRAILDLKVMAELIIKYGFVEVGGENYNYNFIFDSNKFSKIFSNTVNERLRVIPFSHFIQDFPGRILFEGYLPINLINELRPPNLEMSRLNKRDNPRTTEFRYVANFLGSQHSKEFLESQATLINKLIDFRLE